MAPTPSNLTTRVAIKYTSGGLPHELNFRLSPEASFSAAQAKANQIIAVMAPLLPTIDAVIGARYIPALSNISVPMPVDTPSGGQTVFSDTDEGRTCFVSATGRSAGGVDVRVTLFSCGFNGFADYRQAIGVVAADVAAWWAEITDNTPYPLLAADTLQPYWNSYVNIGQNAHFQRKQR